MDQGYFGAALNNPLDTQRAERTRAEGPSYRDTDLLLLLGGERRGLGLSDPQDYVLPGVQVAFAFQASEYRDRAAMG